MKAERVLRGAVLAVGVAGLARGGYLVLHGLPSTMWLSMLIWLAAGVVVHDLLIAPTSLLFGRLLARVLGHQAGVRVVGNALRGAWLGIGTVVLVGIPLAVGAGRRRNWTVIPGRPVLNLFLSLGLVILGAALVVLGNFLTTLVTSRSAAQSGPAR